MVFLDSSFLIDLANARPAAQGRLEGLIETRTPFSIPAPVYYEVRIDLAARRTHTARFFRHIDKYAETPLMRKDAEAAAEIAEELQSEGESIGAIDLLIAGMCRAHRERLLTADRDFEKVKGLRVELFR